MSNTQNFPLAAFEAVVTVAPKVWNTKYGKRCKVGFQPTGTNVQEEKIVWGPEFDQVLNGLVVGQKVMLQPKNNGRGFTVVLLPNAPQIQTETFDQPTASKGYKEPSKDLKKDVKSFIEMTSKMYKFCFEKASDELQDYSLSDDNLRIVATTLFINANQKFNL